MRNKIRTVAAVAALAMSPGVPALAKGHAGGAPAAVHHAAAHPAAAQHAAAHRVAGRDRDDHAPPGWSHGRKVGWGDGHEPPGLARNEHDDHEGERD